MGRMMVAVAVAVETGKAKDRIPYKAMLQSCKLHKTIKRQSYSETCGNNKAC